jgi:orotate phosphoribosyltransferase
MHFKNINDLTNDIHHWIPRLPGQYDCIVGIPRSGMLVANILALKLNLPLVDLDGFLAGRILAPGKRFGQLDKEQYLSKPRKVLIVDDSISSGEALARVKEKIKEVGVMHELTFAAVYVSQKGKSMCDSYSKVVNHPRRFEWNILSTPEIKNYAFDLDGVLCVDPTESQNDDGELYREFILNAKPLYLPIYKIGAIVTSRLEKYRSETEEWLNQQGVKYDVLYMLDLNSKEERIRLRAAPKFKATTYKSSRYEMFVEGDHGQAMEIARLSGRFVYALETLTMHGPGHFSSAIIRAEMTVGRRYAIYLQRPYLIPGKVCSKVWRFLKKD